MADAYIFDALRTPRGKGKQGGALNQATPIHLAATALRALRDRNQLDTSKVDDVVLGCVEPVGEQGADIARVAALYADYAISAPGVTVSRFCASGLEACNQAAAQVMSGQADLVVGGGVESMSRVPMFSSGGAWPIDPQVAAKTAFVPQGISADLIATKWGFSRQDVDAYALESQRRAKAAWDAGHFKKSIVPVKDLNGLTMLAHDEFMRPETTMESLASLKPAFQEQGEKYGFNSVMLQRYPEVEKIEHVHHAGNSSGIVDGAAAVLFGTKEMGAALGLKPRARVRSFASIGSEPSIMLTGPRICGREGAQARRHEGGRHRPLRAQRSLRRRGAALHAGARRVAREDERQRRRHRHGSSAGRHRGDDPRHAAGRDGAAQSFNRAGDAVRRCRDGDCHNH
jgi:acetyl-CoA C-acetyltransferase